MSRRVSLRREIVVLALASLPSTAWAQSSPSSGTYAVRYDLLRRETGTIAPDPDGAAPFTFAATRKTYDAGGRVVKVETGRLTTWQSETIAPANWTGFEIFNQVDTTYDAMDRRIREAVSGGGVTTKVTEYGYDLAGRLKCTAARMNPNVWTTPLTDKCVPGTAHATNGPDRITRNSYTAQGDPLKVEQAVGTGLQQVYAAYTYSPNGQRTSVTDANGNRAEMTYDGLDRQKRWIFPSKTVPGDVDPADYEEYGYDANANRTSVRKRDGSTISFQYDALNRAAVKIVPERSGLTTAQTRDVYYEFDLRGLQTKVRFDSLAGEGVTNLYNGFGELASSTVAMAGTSRTLSYTYDLNGNRKSVVHPDGNTAVYDYDGLDRMTAYRENGGLQLATLTYDTAGRRLTLGLPGATTTYGYDSVSRLASVTNDIAGATTTHDQTQTFAYNSASQVAQRTASNGLYAWSDSNSYVRSYAANGLNQYSATSVGGSPSTYGYDMNGNLTSDGIRTYVYDVENRLVSASGGASAALVYDPLGRLFQTSGGAAGVTQFLYDGDDLLSEFDSVGAILRRYVHGSGTDDPLLWYEGPADGDRRTLVADRQGSIVGVFTGAGASIAINTYDPWGIPGANPVGRFGYTGQVWIPELGLWYYKARIYSPTLGRFLQVDPIGYEDQINLYGYGNNDPVNTADPSGKTMVNCNVDRRENSGTCTESDDGRDDVTVRTSITLQDGSIVSKTKIYSAEEYSSALSEGRDLFSFISAQYKTMGQPITQAAQESGGSSWKDAVSAIWSAIVGAVGGRPSGPEYQTEKEARDAADDLGWQETNELSPGGKGKFYRDSKGNMWTRDRDGHNGGAWKQYDRSGTTRLGTYDKNLNRIGD